MPKMEIAIIGGGINGIMTAWELAKQGHHITLFEKNTLMSQTSSASSKLLHGGLRYLENFEFRLVREALREREWWIDKAPQFARSLKLFIPVYEGSRRSVFKYKLGLWLYDFLAGHKNLGKHKKYSKSQTQKLCPELKTENLVASFSYYDGQMDDYQLGLWVAMQAGNSGVLFHENVTVEKISVEGDVVVDGRSKQFDRVINITGPWANEILENSQVKTAYQLDLVRGSHIVINKKCEHGYLLEAPNERRIFFILPYQGKTLVGTTEQRQELSREIKVSEAEVDYLIHGYNTYFKESISKQDIVKMFAGLRPLIKSTQDPNKATREYVIERKNKLINVFGGKWTTSRQLAKNIVEKIM